MDGSIDAALAVVVDTIVRHATRLRLSNLLRRVIAAEYHEAVPPASLLVRLHSRSNLLQLPAGALRRSVTFIFSWFHCLYLL